MSQHGEEPEYLETFDVEAGGYRRYCSDEPSDYKVERTPCAQCGGTGSYFYPNVTGGGSRVPCSCTQEGQRFWDNT
jgi:hypothetical protein